MPKREARATGYVGEEKRAEAEAKRCVGSNVFPVPHPFSFLHMFVDRVCGFWHHTVVQDDTGPGGARPGG